MNERNVSNKLENMSNILILSKFPNISDAGKFLESLRSYGGTDRILSINDLQVAMEKLKTLPRFGSFGDDERLSDFVFIAK